MTLNKWSLVLPELTRDEAARLYARQVLFAANTTDWERLDDMIIDRWSEAGLRYVKKKAGGLL